MSIIPHDWTPAARMERIICRWTGGTHRPSARDRTRFHFLVDGQGNIIRGEHAVAANQRPIRGIYAAHTLGSNTGSIGAAMCGMQGASADPFDPGNYPVTTAQWNAFIRLLAHLCHVYGIPVLRETLLSRSEVEPTLGIAQRDRWDITRLPFDPTVTGALAIGDRMRAEVAALLSDVVDIPAEDAGPPESPVPATPLSPMVGTVTTPETPVRAAATVDAEVAETLPLGRSVAILDREAGWYQIRTPAGVIGFAAEDDIALTPVIIHEDTQPPNDFGIQKTSSAGRAAIAQREGNSLTAFQDVFGVCTIGVGHTVEDGSPTPKAGLTITAAESDAILERDLTRTEAIVCRSVKVGLNQDEFDALVSFVRDVGPGKFGKSTLLEKLNGADRDGAAAEFMQWTAAGGQTAPRLAARRAAEREQFLTPPSTEPNTEE